MHTSTTLDSRSRTSVFRAVGRRSRPLEVEATVGPGHIFAVSAWFGVLTGLVELAILVIWHGIDSSKVLGALQLNRHFTWMVPAAHLSVFLGGAPFLALVMTSVRRRSQRVVYWFLTSAAVFSLLFMIPGLHPVGSAILAMGIARPISGELERRMRGFHRLLRWSLPVMLGGVVIIAGATYFQVVQAEHRALAALPSPPPNAPNVLLIVLDTVNAEHLSLHGYHRETTPNLASLAGRGVVFEQARSPAPWTLPAHASMFTGRWPHELGGVSGGRPLDATYPTLAEFLASHGYATAGFIGNTYYCNSWYGLGRGFAHYEDYYDHNLFVSPSEVLRCTALGRYLIRAMGTAYNVRPETANDLKDGERINRVFLRWLENQSARPFFAFLNYIDAHDPYQTPPGFDRHFGVKPESDEDVETLRTWHHRKRHDASAHQKDLVLDSYDDCLSVLDEHLGKLFDELERRGRLRDTLVVITSDHGEQFGEHGRYGHGNSLYRPEIHVPLVIFGTSGVPAGLRVSAPVSTRTIAATVADHLEMAGASPFPGRSLTRFWNDRTTDLGDDPILSVLDGGTKSRSTHLRHPKAASIISEDMVYIRSADGREELYDFIVDPDETDDLSKTADFREIRDRCRVALDALVGPVGVRK